MKCNITNETADDSDTNFVIVWYINLYALSQLYVQTVMMTYYHSQRVVALTQVGGIRGIIWVFTQYIYCYFENDLIMKSTSSYCGSEHCTSG